MPHSDKHLGTTVSDGQTTLHWSAYKISYDASAIDLDVETEGYYTEYDTHTLVSDEATRDAIQSLLDKEGVSYETTEHAPTDEEKYIVKREGATTDAEIDTVLKQKGTLFDRALLSSDTKEVIANHIIEIESEDAELGDALRNIFRALTGDSVENISTE